MINEDFLNNKYNIEINEKALYRKRNEECNLNRIQLEITKKCNFKCKHCYLKNKVYQKELSLDSIKKIIDEASKLGCMNIDITGGEPLIHPFLKEILIYINQKGMKTTLYSNGYLINDEWIDFFKSIYLESLRISIDNINEKKCNSIIRNKGTLNTVFSNIINLTQNGIDVSVTTIAMKDNINEVNKISKYLKNTFPQIKHYIDSYIPLSYENKSIDSKVITPKEYSDILCQRCKDYEIKKIHKKSHYCGFAYNYLFIDSEGIVKLCPNMQEEYNIGNIKNLSLFNCFKILKEYSEKMNCKYAQSCQYYSFCAGGCRNRALVFNNDITEKDTYMCEFYENLKNIIHF